jgi:tetratricopeptide (TPR) repeat protein
MSTVKSWKDKVIIPTYEVGKPEKYPVFLDKRVYQASSGVVYPHPVVEHISDEKVDKEWDVVFIENDYIKIMVLPALGGRIQMAYDKIRDRHFVYYNHVIKPALVGLTGPWISGGIEFNWPQHHRPSTYDPIDYYIEENKDGSKTVWVSEVERMFRTKGMAGFTLHPDKAYLEVKAQLYNRTPHPQTFLWWANPAVAVNEHYQSVFPPDVNAVFDHGKRDVSEFPIAKGEYYKVDYAPGTDISRYKNIPVPTSYMAITSDYDFVGGYENDSKGGLLHVADHHLSPGKKQWTWGNGDFGHAWDRNLTDSDGPYIELMCGVYTDNQPDFSWMHPYEEKSFKQYFLPYYNVGVVKNATKDALLNLEVDDQKATVKIHVTSTYPNCTVILSSGNKVFFEDKKDLSPANGFEKTVQIAETLYHELTATLRDNKGKVLISWKSKTSKKSEIPEPAKAAKQPKEIENVEDLYLRGLHLEQYRHATYDPTAYYLEALSREPGNMRNNNAMGLWKLKKGKFEEALSFFDKAIETLTERNPNPYDGEPYFNKGLALSFLEKKDEAYKAFFKSCWNAAWQDAGYFHLAQIDCSRGNLEKALELVDRALIKNWHNHKARHLKVILLRKMGETKKANQLISDSLAIDNFNFGVIYEKYIMSNDKEDLTKFRELLRDYEHNYIEFSLDYAQSGQFNEAIEMLNLLAKGKKEIYPMMAYFLGWYHKQNGDLTKAKEYYQMGQEMPQDYCFPNRLEEVVVLKSAMLHNPSDDKAPYYLGNFWYASKQYQEAQACWETSIKLDDTNPICNRNLALLYFNRTNQKDLARKYLEKAFSLDKNEARLLMELDQLYKKLNVSVDERLQLLEENLLLTVSRDDLYLERVSLYNFKGLFKEALSLIEQRQFHPWEGGEGKVPFQYITTNVELAKQYIKEEEYIEAIKHLEAAQVYPHNLGEGKLFGTQENDIHYWLGHAYEKLGRESLAKESWEKASEGSSDPSPAMFYNDQQPDKIFYQGLALLKLGRKDAADYRFKNLIAYGQQHMDDDVKLDYFAISLPDLLIWEEDLNVLNKIHCTYLIGLGKLGLRELGKASAVFNNVTARDLYHLPATIHQRMIRESSLQIFKI